MDPKLAEIYGTNQVDEVDTEKLAAAALAEGLAESNEIDLSSLSDEDIEALAASVLASSEEGSEEEAEETEEEVEETEKLSSEEADEETQVKVAEADYLGRVMAHSFWQESTEIEKEAKKKEEPGFAAKAGKKLKRFSNKAERFGRKGTDAVAGAAAKAGKAVGSAAKKSGKFVSSHGGSAVAKAVGKGAKAVGKGAGKVGKHLMKNRGKYGLGAAAAGLAGGAAYGMSKKSSALDTLAEQRALEILTANGIELSEETEQEKVSSGGEYEILANAVEARAAEMLEAAGYEFEAEETEE